MDDFALIVIGFVTFLLVVVIAWSWCFGKILDDSKTFKPQERNGTGMSELLIQRHKYRAQSDSATVCEICGLQKIYVEHVDDKVVTVRYSKGGRVFDEKDMPPCLISK